MYSLEQKAKVIETKNRFRALVADRGETVSDTKHGDREKTRCGCGSVSRKKTPDIRMLTKSEIIKGKADNQARKRQSRRRPRLSRGARP